VRVPPAAIAALVWAVVGPPLGVFSPPWARRGGIAVPVTLMSVSVVIEVAGVAGFLFLVAPNLLGVRPLPRLTGRSEVLVRCLALLTGIYHYVFLYVMAPP
jgi:hypothetical protein